MYKGKSLLYSKHKMAQMAINMDYFEGQTLLESRNVKSLLEKIMIPCYTCSNLTIHHMIIINGEDKCLEIDQAK